MQMSPASFSYLGCRRSAVGSCGIFFWDAALQLSKTATDMNELVSRFNVGEVGEKFTAEEKPIESVAVKPKSVAKKD